MQCSATSQHSATGQHSSQGSTSPPSSPPQSSSGLLPGLCSLATLRSFLQSLMPQRYLRPATPTQLEIPQFFLCAVLDDETNYVEYYALKIEGNTVNLTNNEFPRLLPDGFVAFAGEPFHHTSTNIPILKPNVICPNGRHCFAIGMNSTFYRMPGKTLNRSSNFQLYAAADLVQLHSLNPISPIIEYKMPIKVTDPHSIILSGILYCFGGYSLSFQGNSCDWACSFNPATEEWILIPNPRFVPSDMSFVFSVGLEVPTPSIVIGSKHPKYEWLQIFNVSTKSWSLKKFEPKYEGKILNPPANQPVAVDSRFFWYDAVKQWVIGYNPFSGESYLAKVNTHDHDTRDSQPCLAFISGDDGGSLYCCLQWLSPTTINANPMNKLHCLKFLLGCSQTSSGLTTFLDCKVVACQIFLIQGRKSFLDAMVGTGQLERPYLQHEPQLEN